MLSEENTVTRLGIVFFCAQAGLKPRTRTMNKATILDIANRSVRPIYPIAPSARQWTHELYADSQVREDRGFYIPELLSDAQHDVDSQAYAAFEEHAKHLRRTEALVDDAWNLVNLMLASIGDESDSRAMQAEAGLKVIEQKLNKAHSRIDRLDSRYLNLFLAYYKLKTETAEETK